MSTVLNTTAEERKLARAQLLLRNYSSKQLEALDRVYQVAKRHMGTGGGNRAAKLLLGLYNGQRFPFDLTELRGFDDGNLDAALVVMEMDARRTHAEVHVVLEALYITEPVQWQLETWAFRLGLSENDDGIEELRTRSSL